MPYRVRPTRAAAFRRTRIETPAGPIVPAFFRDPALYVDQAPSELREDEHLEVREVDWRFALSRVGPCLILSDAPAPIHASRTLECFQIELSPEFVAARRDEVARLAGLARARSTEVGSTAKLIKLTDPLRGTSQNFWSITLMESSRVLLLGEVPKEVSEDPTFIARALPPEAVAKHRPLVILDPARYIAADAAA